MEENSNKYKLQIDDKEDGTRIDLVLSLHFKEMSRSRLANLIEEGYVRLGGVVLTSKKYKVKAGDFIEIEIPEARELEVEAQNIPLEIVFEDEDVLVVNKPKGMVVHPAAGNFEGTLVNAIMYHCGASLSSINGVIRPGIVHRIDKDTSGLLMVAKNDSAHASLAAQLEVHSITRVYSAIVYNNFSEDEGTVDQPLGRDPKNRLRQAVIPMVCGQLAKGSRRAVTHYRVLERFGKFTFIEARLETGRTHQIRVHMSYIKHPLLGDELYGPAKNPFGVSGQMLHAGTLGFVHPRTGEYMEFHAPLPEEFERVLGKLRREL